MTWIFDSKEVLQISDDFVGFVYLITNNLTGRKYIGKKLTRFTKSVYRVVRLKNGAKRRKRIRNKIESDWQTYYGSNDQLIQDVATLGSENFTREILYYCKTKAECSYIEAREQFARKVLESDDYYNGHIQVRVHGSHIIGKIGIEK